MNNKGQVLIIFVIILPILLMILTLVIDLGFLYIEKRNINNSVYDAVEYYLNNLNDVNINNKIRELLNKNIKDIKNIDIKSNDEYVLITVTKDRKSIYSITLQEHELSITYKGIKLDKKIIKG